MWMVIPAFKGDILFSVSFIRVRNEGTGVRICIQS